MIARTLLTLASLCAVSVAAVRSGKAEADWISESSTYESGKPVQTAVRLVLDPGWHTYWENPGEGGMKISAKWELPTGWTAGELEHPVPVRFKAGGLVGFGYKGTVVFPVTFTPPVGFTGGAKLKGKITWLACNEDQCIPGGAELELALNHGPAAETPEAKIIREALGKVPQPQEKRVRLGVTEKPASLLLTIKAPPGAPLNPEDYEIFTATPQTIQPVAAIQFTRDGSDWTAEVPKCEYIAKPISELTLVLAGKSGQPPMSLTWKSD
jgi:DsbC/DsbD-like thiol-disulfide interchange protein